MTCQSTSLRCRRGSESSHHSRRQEVPPNGLSVSCTRRRTIGAGGRHQVGLQTLRCLQAVNRRMTDLVGSAPTDVTCRWLVLWAQVRDAAISPVSMQVSLQALQPEVEQPASDE